MLNKIYGISLYTSPVATLLSAGLMKNSTHIQKWRQWAELWVFITDAAIIKVFVHLFHSALFPLFFPLCSILKQMTTIIPFFATYVSIALKKRLFFSKLCTCNALPVVVALAKNIKIKSL